MKFALFNQLPQVDHRNLYCQNSFTRHFRRCCLYCHITLVVFSTTAIFTAKFHYFQIPYFSRNYLLPSNSNTCEFQDNRFTAEFHYLQNPLLITFKIHYLQIDTTHLNSSVFSRRSKTSSDVVTSGGKLFHTGKWQRRGRHDQRCWHNESEERRGKR